MKDLLELAELAWNGELDLQFEHHPVHAFIFYTSNFTKMILFFTR